MFKSLFWITAAVTDTSGFTINLNVPVPPLPIWLASGKVSITFDGELCNTFIKLVVDFVKIEYKGCDKVPELSIW